MYLTFHNGGLGNEVCHIVIATVGAEDVGIGWRAEDVGIGYEVRGQGGVINLSLKMVWNKIYLLNPDHFKKFMS